MSDDTYPADTNHLIIIYLKAILLEPSLAIAQDTDWYLNQNEIRRVGYHLGKYGIYWCGM